MTQASLYSFLADPSGLYNLLWCPSLMCCANVQLIAQAGKQMVVMPWPRYCLPGAVGLQEAVKKRDQR